MKELPGWHQAIRARDEAGNSPAATTSEWAGKSVPAALLPGLRAGYMVEWRQTWRMHTQVEQSLVEDAYRYVRAAPEAGTREEQATLQQP